MCEFTNKEQIVTGEDQYFMEHPSLSAFIEKVNEIRGNETDPHVIVAKVRPAFERLLADQDWLEPKFAERSENSGMGGGIGMWLLYRAGDGSLAFSTLVVPSGAQTPVHDHLAWGSVGLYRGTQDEDVYQRRDDASADDYADLELIHSQSLNPGDLYELLPENDIHRVRTTSETTSVSLHLLGNDNGCIWRHRFYPDEQKVVPFKSGWLNVPCVEQTAAAD